MIKKNILYVYVFAFNLIFLYSCATSKSNIKINNVSTKENIDSVIQKIKPALVQIHVVATSFRDGKEVKQESAGSGVIIDSKGYIITNHHVVGKSAIIICTLSSKEEIDAELIGTDPLSDISIIKLKKETISYPKANFGDSDKIKVGDNILAMGSPFALSQSVTMGIVSNTEMVMPKLFWPFNKFDLEGEDVGSIVRWIGHDAPIYGGNSGGPLVNFDGEIIGINEISMGLSGAIPGNLAKRIANELIKNKEISRTWFGFLVQPVLKSSTNIKGALISGVIENSPASKAGFLPGDILLKLNNADIAVDFIEELPLLNQLLMDFIPGKEINAIVLRNGKEENLKVIPIKRENVRPPVQEIKSWGVAASNISFLQAQEMERENKNGVLVTSIRPGGPSDEAKPKIKERDVLIEINNQPINSLDDLIKITKEITDKATVNIPVLVKFDRRKEKYLTVVKVGDIISEQIEREAKKAWLPINTQVLTKELCGALNIKEYTGVRITSIYPGLSAEKAGLKVGDLIIQLDGESIHASEPQDIEVFPNLIKQYKIGSQIELTILREKEQIKLKVELASTPPMKKEMKKYRDNDYEFTVRDISFFDKTSKDKSQNEIMGVLVDSVDEGGWAALSHLAVGDVILKINNLSIDNTASMEKIMKEIKLQKNKYTVFQVQRGIYTLFVELETK